MLTMLCITKLFGIEEYRRRYGMLCLSRTGIRGLASSDTEYSRGLQYYKSNRVLNAAFSKSAKQYKFTVMGNFQYFVIITENKDGSFEHSCNCPAHLKEKGACKHEVAALLFLLKYQEKTMMEAPQSIEDKKAYQVLDYFSNQEEPHTNGDIFHIQVTIILNSLIRGDSGGAAVVLHAGSNRLYKIQFTKKFLSSYYQHENIILGKEFKYIAGESEFDKSSKEILDFLLEIYEIQQMGDRAFYSTLFSKSQIVITKNLLIKLLHIIGKNRFRLELYGKIYEDVKFVTENPYISYDLDDFDDAILLNYRDRESIIPLIENGGLIYHNGFIHQPDKRFLRNFLPFYNTLSGDKKPLVFRGENRQKFLEEVLPRLHDTMDIIVPESLKCRYLTFDVKPSIYFDKYYNDIKAELRFQYGEYEFNCFEDPKTDSFIIIRQKDKEYKIMKLLEELDFEPHSSFYLLKNDTSIFSFLSEKLNNLSEICDLYYSEDFKKLTVHTNGRFRVSLRAGIDIDLLEMELDFDDIPRDELSSLFRSFQLKKKYYRLKDGSFIHLDNDNIRSMSEIFENVNILPKNMKTDNIKLNKNTAFYLNEALENGSFIVEKDIDFTKFIDKILTPANNDYELPDKINAELHPYQLTGFRWMSTLADHNLGGILADDMGLGKTLQSIVYIVSRLDGERKFLIVCPTSLVFNWLDEFENFAPDIKAGVVNGTPQERQATIESLNSYQVLITSYPLIRRDIVRYQKINFDTVFIDEAQFIKNATSLNAQSVKGLLAEHRFALTGTPIENSLSELWSIFDFIMPNYLMSHSKFIQKYEKLIMKEDSNALEGLNRRIHPFILRRMKKDVLKELPDKTEEKFLTEMTDDQKKVYLSYIENIKHELSNEIAASGIERNQIKILAALTRLRQICCHPGTFLDNYQGGSGKLNLLLEVLEDAIANGHRILVFSQFTTMLQIIEKELQGRNIKYFYLQGSTSMTQRSEIVKQFNSGEGEVFLISLKAGGTGLNLIGADMVIHYDPWWNPAVEEQATDRAYRIGQKKNVHVIKLITKGTIEEKIYKLQKKKKELSDSVIQSKEVFINLLTKEELEDIFR